jgi:hypothetical protein
MRSAVAVLFLCLIASQVLAHSSKRSQRSHVDPEYSAALAAVNRFLHAWQTQDHETGIVMLSDTAREHVSPEQLQEFFSPTGTAAFEIEHGRKRNARSYAFPVVLFGMTGTHERPRACNVILIKAGKDDWAVERLP